MSQPTNRSLKQNPFLTYRDPNTGQWLVVKSDDELSGGLPNTDRSRTHRTKEPSLTVLDGGMSKRSPSPGRVASVSEASL